MTQVTSPINRGWPCYEGSFTGSQVQQGWNSLDKPLCETLYAAGPFGAVSAPYFSYQTRGPLLTPGEDCENQTSSVSGIAFGSASSNYPGAVQGCDVLLRLRPLVHLDARQEAERRPRPDRDPARSCRTPETPVDLVAGPGGDLYYVDYGLDDLGVPTENAAGVHRIVYTGSNAAPTARIAANPTSGPAPLTVSFDGTTSTDPDGDTLTYAWDLDANGSYETTRTPRRRSTYAVGTYNVGLRVDDGHGHTVDRDPADPGRQLRAGARHGHRLPRRSPGRSGRRSTSRRRPPTPSRIPFQPRRTRGTWPSGTAPSDVCHTHNLTTFPGVSSGSFQAPDHEYPSHLLLTVTVTDSGGLTDSRTVQLNPKSVALSFASAPSGATVTVNGNNHTTPYSETFIQGSRVTITAAPTTGSGSTVAAFASWSDGGARSHEISAPATPTTYTATYTLPDQNTAPTVTRVTAYPAGRFHVGQTLGFDATATDSQQALPDSAYSFAMERQDCDSGCPRVLVQTWTGVRNGLFLVPELPYHSHLYLVATATDAHGATGRSELRIDPQPTSLTVRTKGKKLKVVVAGEVCKDGWSGHYVVGSTVSVAAPKHQVRKGVRYRFVRWSDGGARKHVVQLWDSAVTLTAIYRRAR